MIQSTRRYQLITGLAVALLLLSAGVSGAVTVILGATLFVIGLIVYPEMRRAGIIAGAIAAGVAIAIAFLGQL